MQHNCLRANTILNANAKLVEAHSKLPIVHKWGGGQVASADGLLDRLDEAIEVMRRW
ncbi:Tn3 family transposase [Meiothermus hypogaeus]|uniref:Tn3 transposase DDE domain-containing protein n=1 Tax=Meiothermus hypogaeus NBRC 106114 TaxID=1227553 RepID=A0A511QZT0_9DEIN|nr:Tn3 family transposase [Meiothermus hypogaeus]GEM82226.1 hypothetical protein MHY01S_03920 [Meiothermus hypogaeus NBRC 106114]